MRLVGEEKSVQIVLSEISMVTKTKYEYSPELGVAGKVANTMGFGVTEVRLGKKLSTRLVKSEDRKGIGVQARLHKN